MALGSAAAADNLNPDATAAVVGLSIFGGLALEILIVGLLGLILFIPSWAVAVRRLHDIGESGLYLFMGCIPLIGQILLLIAFCTDSQPGKNQYGISEKYPSEEE